jgi:hypothetical protein
LHPGARAASAFAIVHSRLLEARAVCASFLFCS